METLATFSIFLLFVAWRQSACSPTPQFFNFPSNSDLNIPPFGAPPETKADGFPATWKLNATNEWPGVDPVLAGQEGSGQKLVQPRQAPQAFTSETFPKIFKVDDFIIISNPKPASPTPCIPPQRPPFMDDVIENRLGDQGDSSEPSRCVWSIIACCSPGSRNIRYACFELLGCPGAFWDVNPCDDKVVMAAATVALNFYSQRTNSSMTSPPYPPP